MTTTTDKDRIRLAERMGWRWAENCNKDVGGGKWYLPDGSYTQFGSKYAGIPKPFTDANDCYVLIKHLNGLGWDVRIDFGCSEISEVSIRSNRVPATLWHGNSYMQGVCELALKVLK